MFEVPITDFIFNYTFRTMLIGSMMIGVFSGVLGSFLYLRHQSLVSDVIGHSAILGVTGSFVFATLVLQVNGRSMLTLTIGAVIASTLAVLLANWIAADSRIGIDAAMAICLALFFGGGMIIMRFIIRSNLPKRGGITDYVFGNAATLVNDDLVTIAVFGILALSVTAFAWKEFKLFSFDPIQAEMMGFKASIISPLMLTTITVAVVIGVKAVGLILMIAFAIMPAVAARQWTNHLFSMVSLSGAIGAISAAIGCYLSVNLGSVPTGPVIVVVLSVAVIGSFLFAPRGLVARRSNLGKAVQASQDESATMADEPDSSVNEVPIVVLQGE
ncbi:metal ABC transporter permease [Stomatohabitans albus]|uniref:metal ABC transporter permease n=1 Tax=Stomatohabitans albus TaxID=3110766 RepID=UPI00300C2FFC